MKNLIEKGKNKSGVLFLLCSMPNGNGIVYKECFNYKHGNTNSTFRFCQPNSKMPYSEVSKIGRDGMKMTEAVNLFNKKLSGSTK